MGQQSERVGFVSSLSNVSAAIHSSQIRDSIYRVIFRLFVGHFQHHILCFGGTEGEGDSWWWSHCWRKEYRKNVHWKIPHWGFWSCITAAMAQPWQQEPSNPRKMGFALLCVTTLIYTAPLTGSWELETGIWLIHLGTRHVQELQRDIFPAREVHLIIFTIFGVICCTQIFSCN